MSSGSDFVRTWGQSWRHLLDSNGTDDPIDWDDWDDEEGDDPVENTPEQDQQEFYDMTVDLYFQGKLNARDLCVLAHWAKKAGAQGPIVDLAFNPKSHSSHFQRHLDIALGLKVHDQKMYKMEVPIFNKQFAGRCSRR